jgi:GT2 family glycosyltransferase
MKNFAIIIPNYNGAAFIKDTITAFNISFPDIKVIIVDDASQDNSRLILQELDCIVLLREINGGFAAAVNTGLKWMLREGYEFALIANSDLIITEEIGSQIYSLFDHHFVNPNIAILGFQEAGCFTQRLGEEISGFLFGLRLNILDKIGLLDESFIMYGEERDFFRRVILSGREIKQSGIFVSHLTEGSGSSSTRSSWLALRNAIYLEFKFGNWTKLCIVVFVLFFLINKLYFPKDFKSDPSYARVTRIGKIKGNYFLLKALVWNTNRYFNEIYKNAKSKFNTKN